MSIRDRISLILFTITLLFFSNLIGKSYGENQKGCLLLPQELFEVASNKGYEQVTDFYKNRPGMLNPPYAYGYLPGPKENSAVFWCQKERNGQKIYYLVFMFKKRNHELCNCPDVIEWYNYPKGLSIHMERNATLNDFVYIDNPKKKVPKNSRLEHNAVLSEYDGVEELFYCYDGEWLVRIRH